VHLCGILKDFLTIFWEKKDVPHNVSVTGLQDFFFAQTFQKTTKYVLKKLAIKYTKWPENIFHYNAVQNIPILVF
jgi:hypothetical protein